MKKILFILLLLPLYVIYSQEDAKNDPKVGLVLSGGGAKGLAHIGALKVIEDAGIRIDYIGGTSMGAIVGALYASGYSARQLDSIFKVLDFNTLIQDRIPRNAKTFYEKEESEKYSLTLPFDNFEITFPTSLSKGQNVYNLLSKLLSHVSAVEDFNNLPIPFFCVATDVETGKEIILDKGYLPRAITASGALPSLFSPQEMDGKLLIDGGVINNYPVERVRSMGADIIIGVDVQDSLRPRTKLKSVFDLAMQIGSYRTIKDMADKKAMTDVYIKPNVEKYSIVSFDQGNDIISIGEQEALLHLNVLKNIAKDQVAGEKTTPPNVTNDTLFISSVNITGNENYTRSYIMGKLKIRTPTRTLYSRFSEGINNLAATGNFQGINYNLIENDTGETHVSLHVTEKKSKTLLRLGAHYDDLFDTAALINITEKRIFTNNDILSFDFIVGDHIRYNLDYYIDKGFYWSIGLNSSYNFFDIEVPISFVSNESMLDPNTTLNHILLQYGDVSNQLYVETLFRRTLLFGIGAEHKWLRYLSETYGVDENEGLKTIFENTNYLSAYGYLKFDTLDNRFFPKNGVFFEGDIHLYVHAIGVNKEFDQFSILKFKGQHSLELSERISMRYSGEIGLKFGGENTSSLDFLLGGYGYRKFNNLIPFLGYEPLSLRGNNYLKSNITFDLEFHKNNHINLFANVANIGNDLFKNDDWAAITKYSGYGIGYGFESLLGPIEVKYAFSPERDMGEWHVSVGFSF